MVICVYRECVYGSYRNDDMGRVRVMRRNGFDGTIVWIKNKNGVVYTEDESWCGYMCIT